MIGKWLRNQLTQQNFTISIFEIPLIFLPKEAKYCSVIDFVNCYTLLSEH